MKLNTFYRFAALGTALALSTALAGCGANTTTAATSETASSEAASSEVADSAAATAEDAWADIANFKLSDAFDNNGYFKDVTARDYVTLPEDYNALSLPAGTDKLGETAVSDYITNNILSSFSTTKQVTDRAAADGDAVNIDYVGSIDGTEFDGGNTQGKGSDITLGAGRLIDDFEEQITGHTPGDTFDVTVTFPEDYTNTDLAGKEAVFATTLNYISENVVPELTDAWVAENLKESAGVGTVAELQNYVSQNLLFDQESSAVYSALSAATTYADTLPETVTEFGRNYFVYNLYQNASQYGVDMNTMLSASGYASVDDYLTAAESSIQGAVKQLLLVQAVAEAQSITCDDAALPENLLKYYHVSDPTKFTDAYGANYVKMMLLNDMTMDNLFSSATIAAE